MKPEVVYNDIEVCFDRFPGLALGVGTRDDLWAFQGDRKQLFEVLVAEAHEDITLPTDDSKHLPLSQEILEARMDGGN